MGYVTEIAFSTFLWTFCHSGLSSSQWQEDRLNYFLEKRPILHLHHLCVPSTRHHGWHIVNVRDTFITWMKEGMVQTHLSNFLKTLYNILIYCVTSQEDKELSLVHYICVCTMIECELCRISAVPMVLWLYFTLFCLWSLYTLDLNDLMIQNTSLDVKRSEEKDNRFWPVWGKSSFFALLLDWVYIGLYSV